MKKIARSLCALLWLSMAASAVDFAALQPEGYVSDFARVIDPASRAALENYCARVEAQTGAQIAVVTLETLAGEPVEDVANALFRKWGIGKKGTNEGVLLLLVTQDRRMRLEVGYGLEPIIPDGVSGSVLRSMSPALREVALRRGRDRGGARPRLPDRGGQGSSDRRGAPPGGSPRRPIRFPWPLGIFGLFFLFWILAGIGGGGGRRGGGSGPVFCSA